MTGRRLFANLGALAVGRLVSMMLAVVMVALITRRLGPALYGQITLAAAFTLVVSVIADAGVSMIAPRDLARIEDEDARRRVAASIATLSLLLFCVCTAVGVGIAYAVFRGRNQTLALEATAVLLAAGLLTPFTTVGGALASAGHRQHLIAVAQIVSGLCALASLMALIAIHARPYVLMAPYALGAVVSGAVLMALPTQSRRRFVVDRRIWRTTLRESLPMLAVTSINTVYAKVDVMLLAALTTSAVVGRYGLAYKVVDATITLPGLFVLVAQPQMVKAYSGGRSFDRVVSGSMLAIYALAVPMGVVLIRFASGTAILLGGQHFVGSGSVIRILTIAVVLTFPTAILSAGLMTMGKQRRLVYTTSAAAVTNIASNLILIPTLGMLGAALALVVSEATVLSVFVWTYRKFAPLPRPRHLGAVAVPTAGMLVVAIAGPLVFPFSPTLELVGWGTASIGVYAACAWRTGLFQAVAADLGPTSTEALAQNADCMLSPLGD